MPKTLDTYKNVQTDFWKKGLLYFIVILCTLNTNAQDSLKKILVAQINISGNKKTKNCIILREVLCKVGDTLNQNKVDSIIKESKIHVYNTTLFSEVNIDTTIVANNQIAINIKVKERWYIYPVPQLQLIDRNYNEWLVKYKGDLSRVNYGVKFNYYNFTQQKDVLKLVLLNGFNRVAGLSYTKPYVNKNLTHGFSIGATYIESKEIPYKTSYDNKRYYFDNGTYSGKTLFLTGSFIIRNAIKNRHIFTLSYSNFSVNDSMLHANWNPNYFNNSSSKQSVVDMSYTYLHTDVDNVSYPLKGITYAVAVAKRGFELTGGLNMLSIEGAFQKYWPLKKDWNISIQSFGKIRLPFDQPYINQRALGYGENYLRGLEYYVIDGVAYNITKATLKKKVFSCNIPVFPKYTKSFKIPITIYAKTYGDMGYSYTLPKYETYLNNQLLYTGGFGIDIVTLYDITLKLEYSFNQLNQNGLFLHTQGGF